MRHVIALMGSRADCSTRVRTIVMLFVAAWFGTAGIASAATFIVNSTIDAADGAPGDGHCETVAGNGVCTLRAAIQESNAVAGFPPAEIRLAAGTYILNLGSLSISDSVFVRGQDAATTVVDGNNASRVFSLINPGSDPIVSIDKVHIRNGQPADLNGGAGILIFDGVTLSLTDSIVSGNKSDLLGAGIRNRGFLSIVNSTIRDNMITGETTGGGVTAIGGGIFNDAGATTTILRSTISGNQATRGGGIDNQGHVEIINSTISGNRVFAGGGGIRNVTVSPPVFLSGTVFMAFTTITQNVANLGAPDEVEERTTGGGILNFGTVSIGNSLVAGNTDNRFASEPLFSPDCFSRTDINGTFTSFRGNLVGVVNANCNLRDTIFGNTAFDLVGSAATPLNPQLGPLSSNGGLTRTHALLAGSPAVGHGTGVTSATFFDCPSTDQRGRTRPVNFSGDPLANCDVGAFEFGAVTPSVVNTSMSQTSQPATSLTTTPTPNGPAGTFKVTAMFTNSSTTALRRPFFQVTELSGGNLLLNADGPAGGVGATLTPDVGADHLLAPNESVTVEFRIGLQTLNPFTFLVNVLGEPAP